MVHPDNLPTQKLRSKRFLYHVMHGKDWENPIENGIEPVDASAELSIDDAIACNKDKKGKIIGSQFVHTTFSSLTALYFAEAHKDGTLEGQKSANKIAKIDLFKLSAAPRIIDRSGPKSNLLEKKKNQKYCNDYDIVLLSRYVNASAVVKILDTKKLKLGKKGKDLQEFSDNLPDATRDLIDDFHFNWSKKKGKGKGKKGKGKGRVSKGKGKGKKKSDDEDEDDEAEESEKPKKKKGSGKGKKGKGKGKKGKEKGKGKGKKGKGKGKGKKGDDSDSEDDDDDDDDITHKGKGKKGKKGKGKK